MGYFCCSIPHISDVRIHDIEHQQKHNHGHERGTTKEQHTDPAVFLGERLAQVEERRMVDRLNRLVRGADALDCVDGDAERAAKGDDGT